MVNSVLGGRKRASRPDGTTSPAGGMHSAKRFPISRSFCLRLLYVISEESPLVESGRASVNVADLALYVVFSSCQSCSSTAKNETRLKTAKSRATLGRSLSNASGAVRASQSLAAVSASRLLNRVRSSVEG